MVGLYASIICDSRGKVNRLDIERELRTLSTNYRMNISRFDISDAVDEWIKGAQLARLYEIFLQIDTADSKSDRWTELAEAVFDCSDTSPEYVAAVLKKFVWQVKRKIRDMPVTDHLMPVILGPQGVGKSTLVNQMLSPVDELKLNVHFNMLTDDRNVEIWSSYVMFLDEMGYASKADIDTVKNVITASSLTRRPMATNSKITITQNATFIGCSNKELSQLVRDPTGNRRFAAIRMRSDADRDLINSIDWAPMWGRVDIEAADPMAGYRDVLAAQQDVTRERSRVEQWMDEFDGTCNIYQSSLIGKMGNLSAMNLYLCFQAYENAFYPSGYKTSKTDWDYEMTRLSKNSPDSMIFTKKRMANGNSYRWKNEQNQAALRLV
jgi:Virulence-associated protein E